MKMLRWMTRVSLRDKIKSEETRRRCGEDIRVAYEIEVEGSRLRGRPKKTWRDQLRKDIQEIEIREKEAQDRKHWWTMVRAADPTVVWELGRKEEDDDTLTPQ